MNLNFGIGNFLVGVDAPLNLYLLITGLIKCNQEWEYATLLPLGFAFYISSKLLNHMFWNMQPQAYSFSIYGLGPINESKELKEFVLIFFFNANSIILHWDFNHSMFSFVQ